MKTFIVILIISALIQTSFLPLNLCLLLIVCRSIVVTERLNYYLAFMVGILVGILGSQNMGEWALIYIGTVWLSTLSKRLPVSHNLVTVIPILLIVIGIANFAEQFLFNTSIEYSKMIMEMILSLPIFLLVKFWEERFTVKAGIRLKLRN